MTNLMKYCIIQELAKVTYRQGLRRVLYEAYEAFLLQDHDALSETALFQNRTIRTKVNWLDLEEIIRKIDTYSGDKRLLGKVWLEVRDAMGNRAKFLVYPKEPAADFEVKVPHSAGFVEDLTFGICDGELKLGSVPGIIRGRESVTELEPYIRQFLENNPVQLVANRYGGIEKLLQLPEQRR